LTRGFLVGVLLLIPAWGRGEPLPDCPPRFLELDLVEGGPFWPLALATRLANEMPESYGRALAGDPPKSEAFVVDLSRGTVFDLFPDHPLEAREVEVRCSPVSASPLFEIVQKCRLETGLGTHQGPTLALEVGVDRELRIVVAGSDVPTRVCSLGGDVPAHPPLATLVASPGNSPVERVLPDPTPPSCDERSVLDLKEGDRFWPLFALIEHLDAHPADRATYLRGRSEETGLVWEWVLDDKNALTADVHQRRTAKIACSRDVASFRERGFTQAATRCTLELPYYNPFEVALDENGIVIAAVDLFRRADCGLGGERQMPPDLPASARDPAGRFLLSISRTLGENLNLDHVIPKLETLAGAPAFLGDASHNPEFVRWLRETALPIWTDPSLRSVAQSTYDKSARTLVRGLYGMSLFLELRPAGRDLLSKYREAVKEGRYPTFPYAAYDFVSQPHEYIAFWERRDADGTAAEYRDVLERVLETFDPDYLPRVEAFAGFEELPLYERSETDLSRSIAFYLGVEGQSVPIESDKHLTLVDAAGQRCRARFARTSRLANDCPYETNPPDYLLGSYDLEAGCSVEEAVAILPGDVPSLEALRFDDNPGPPVSSLLGEDEVETEVNKTWRVLFGPIHPYIEFPRFQLVGRKTLGETGNERFQILVRDVEKQCTTRSAGDLVKVECPDAGRLLFVDGRLVASFRGHQYEKTPLEGATLEPVARYRSGELDVIVLSPGVALVRAGNFWHLMHRGGVVGHCDL
jgi:hypothetical protein